MLYPLKFRPIYKERIWGGRRLESSLGKQLPADGLIGESWELSGVDGDVSVVAEGKLLGNSLNELIEVYMGDLVGEAVFDRFGEEFPLLIKFIDANDTLSIQVHPDDQLALERHSAYGKTEMWYVIDHDPDAELYVGFNQAVTPSKFLDSLTKGNLEQLMQSYVVSNDTAYFIPARTLHSIGKGILLVEVQQTSDITYRVFDWNRVDAKTGQQRELHTHLAMYAIDFQQKSNYEICPEIKVNTPVPLKKCPYFETNIIKINTSIERDYAPLDSFVILICIEGSFQLETSTGTTNITCGETVLLPAIIDSATFSGKAKIMEVFIPEN